MTPAWVGPTIALALVVIAASFLVMGGVALALGLAVRRHSRAARAQLAAFAGEARQVTGRLRHELEGYADLSAQTRGKLQAAVASVEQRLRDIDALVEVLHEEAEATALDVAALVRTVRRSGAILGAARRSLRRRREPAD
jgi:hypothetical protein